MAHPFGLSRESWSAHKHHFDEPVLSQAWLRLAQFDPCRSYILTLEFGIA